jgi:hypothetical protein
MKGGFTLHVVHVAGTRIMSQGTDGVSRDSLMEGVMAGGDMLDHVDLAKTALERRSELLSWAQDWSGVKNLTCLTPEEWFVEGRGITGGYRDDNNIWIPTHVYMIRRVLADD